MSVFTARARISSVAAATALTALLSFGGGCQAIVDGEVPAFTCRGTAPDTCPRGMYCNGAGCVACEKEDPCDGRDNDCNGAVDDGPTSDHDGDGITFCGKFSAEENRLVDLDCNDEDPEIYPDAPERCNGIDDDCDGIADNVDRVCEKGQVCAPRGGGCIPEGEACTPANCAPPKKCDESTQKCINPTANLPLGADCGSDQECASGVCATNSMVGGALKTNKGVCSQPCCNSAQCAMGFVCYAPGTGGRYCLAPDLVGRPKTLGIVDPGGNCSTPQNCRSGVCTNGKCLDTCCSNGDCTNGATCQFVESGGKSYFGCAPPPGSKQRHDTCSAPTECASNLCAFYAQEEHCVSPCCSSTADCGTVSGTKILCVNARSALTKNAIVAACVGTVGINASKSFGDTCTANDECFSGLCDGVTARCSSLCCLDSDCPRNAPCRPAPSGVLRCVP